jgi:hypothetical protein
LARAAFWCYVVVLFTATHWPNLRIESAYMERPDILIHLTCFGTWAALLILSGYMARGASDPLAESRGVRGWVGMVTQPRVVGLAWVVAVGYAAFDELSQGIPGLGRTVGWDDYGANCTGITLAAVGALVVGRVWGGVGR